MTIPSINPATGETIKEYTLLDEVLRESTSGVSAARLLDESRR